MGRVRLNRHVVKRVLAACDFGWTNPGCIQTFALDGDGRAYMVHEIYRTQKTIDWWIEQAKQTQAWFGTELFICDPSEPAYIDQFNKAGLPAVGANHDIPPGINALKSRLHVQPDGRARFYVYENALEDRDELREAARLPYCFENEINEYVWPQEKGGKPVKEVPVKVNDHAMDAARYFCNFLAEPILTPQEHIEHVKRRVEISQQRQVAPIQGVWR